MKRVTPQYYKGFGLNYIRGKWRAEAKTKNNIMCSITEQLKLCKKNYMIISSGL